VSVLALLHIMAHGAWEGQGIGDPRFRATFRRESVGESDWYKERLRAERERDIALWSRHIAALEAFASGPGSRELDVSSRGWRKAACS
jgi:phosphoenolpyruvate carboxykinase (diphosphate)